MKWKRRRLIWSGHDFRSLATARKRLERVRHDRTGYSYTDPMGHSVIGIKDVLCDPVGLNSVKITLGSRKGNGKAAEVGGRGISCLQLFKVGVRNHRNTGTVTNHRRFVAAGKRVDDRILQSSSWRVVSG